MSLVAPPSTVAPAYLWVPEHSSSSAGAEAADLASSLGFMVDAPERATLDTLLAEGPDGRWAGLEAGVICGRQNIKTWALEMTVLYDAFLRDVRRVVWTSHRFKTTQSAFADLQSLVENYDWLRKRVKKVRFAAGDEGFELIGGTRVDFLARTSGGGRGLTGDTVILDEALFLSPIMLGSLLPTLSARPDPHVRYGSSPGVRESEVLRGVRKRGRKGGDPSLAYIEFTSEREPCADPMCTHLIGTEGCQLDNETKWAQANPALGRRISVDYVRSERRALPPVEFMRERLGWWEDPPSDDGEQAIPAEAWAERLDATSSLQPGCRVTFAVDTSWDRQTTWIAAAGIRDDGTPHIEVVATNYGSDWVLPWLRERIPVWSPVSIAMQGSGSPVSSIFDICKAELGDLVISLGAGDLGRACGSFFDAVVAGPLAHTDQEQLNQAIKHATVRLMGDAWLWDRKASPVDIAPLVAVTEALYSLTSTIEQPKKRSRVIGW